MDRSGKRSLACENAQNSLRSALECCERILADHGENPDVKELLAHLKRLQSALDQLIPPDQFFDELLVRLYDQLAVQAVRCLLREVFGIDLW